MVPSVKDVLVEMRELLSDPKRWTKGMVARNAKHEPCSSISGEAVCFCLWGAEVKVLDKHRRLNTLLESAVDEVMHECSPQASVSMFNDNEATTHADVMRYLDRCIKVATNG